MVAAWLPESVLRHTQSTIMPLALKFIEIYSMKKTTKLSEGEGESRDNNTHQSGNCISHYSEDLLPTNELPRAQGPVVYLVVSHLRATPWSSSGFYQYFHFSPTQSS